jgi:hypothetical protein
MISEEELKAKDAINRLMLAYCSNIDKGQLDDMAALFSRGTWIPSPGSPLKGQDAVAGFLNDFVILYDGVPKTRHVISNVLIDLADDVKSATAESYVIIYQAVDDSGPQIILQGYYNDTFTLDDGVWCFNERHVFADGMGDVSKHIRS